MKSIDADQSAVTEPSPWAEPTDADLWATELEMPVVLAEVDELDVEIQLLDRPVSEFLPEFDERRLRRARARVLAARRDLANRTATLTRAVMQEGA